jgi:two-component system LytT family sensor kinase
MSDPSSDALLALPAETSIRPAAVAASASRRRTWLLAALGTGFWLGIGTFLALAEWQHYVQRGGLHPWEPFLWEISGSLSAGLLAVAVFRGNEWLMAPGRARAVRVAGYLAGAPLFSLAHTVLMYSMRALVYAFTSVAYEPGSAGGVFGYEGAKDVVTYVLVLVLSFGLRALRRDRARAVELAQLQQHLAEARLARLQEQIQPHFLFNTLNLVSSVMHEDVERADRILCELADLLRQSMSASRVAEHSVAHEMRWVEPFLSIMGQRFGDRLRARVEVSPAASRCLVPTLLLMAPVENAVKHGVARSAGVVEVRVLADVIGGELLIDVIDTGDGVAAGATTSEGGTGLANARARLAAIYGAAAELTLRREDGSTRVRLTLPAKAAP